MKRIVAILSTIVVGLGVLLVGSQANASNPATSTVYDVNSQTWTVSGGTNAVLIPKSVQCDANAYNVIGGGVIINDATDNVPPKGTTIATVYSAPQYGGSSAKDTWSVMLKADAGTSSITYSVTVYAVCAIN
jgi:hypothetical protein